MWHNAELVMLHTIKIYAVPRDKSQIPKMNMYYDDMEAPPVLLALSDGIHQWARDSFQSRTVKWSFDVLVVVNRLLLNKQSICWWLWSQWISYNLISFEISWWYLTAK